MWSVKNAALWSLLGFENSIIFYATGNSKKDAEQKAAKLLLKKIGL